MSSHRVDLSPLAEREARHAFVWYLERNPLAADAFEAELSAALETIAVSPRQAPEVEPGLRRRLLQRFPYALLYSVEQESVLILTVSHVRRRPGYWK